MRPWLCLLLAVPLLTGCATANNKYSASNIPAALLAPSTANPQIIRFSELSGAGSSSEIIGRGDVIEVTLAPSLNSKDIFSFSSQVGEEGAASLPLIGPVQLAGMELEGAAAVITQSSIQRGLYVAPHVTVLMKRKKMNRIMVTGAVKQPGLKSIPAGESDLLSCIFHAGGLADDAGINVEIRNVQSREEALQSIAAAGAPTVTQTGYSTSGGPKAISIDLISATQDGHNSYFVGDGGVVHIEKRDLKAVHVSGLVRKPGDVPFPVTHDLSMLEALSKAGYTSSQVADKIYVIRQLETMSEPAVIQASIRKAKLDPAHNLKLAPGDIVSVEHTPATVMLEAVKLIRVGVSGSINPFL